MTGPHELTMIGRPLRTLPTSCESCTGSRNYCDCCVYLTGEKCCEACSHEENA